MHTNSRKLMTIKIAICLIVGLAGILSISNSSFSLLPTAYAQEKEEEAIVVEGAPTTLLDYWKQGGPTMWPLLAIAIWATSLLVELFLKLRKTRFCPDHVVQQLSGALSVADYQKAWRLAIDNPCPLSSIFAPAIEKLPNGREAVEEAAAEASTDERNIYTTKNSYISLVAAIGPMLGLFGTISGMVGAFNAMAYGGAVGDPTKLAGDIGEALITTYTGLLIAIPSMVIYYIIANKLKKMMGFAETAFAELLDLIDFEKLPPDLIVATKEMKAMAMAGALAQPAIAETEEKAPGAKKGTPVSQPAEEAKSEMVSCPNCKKEIKVGTKKCPYCNTEIEWE